jgi:hypothetical protein
MIVSKQQLLMFSPNSDIVVGSDRIRKPFLHEKSHTCYAGHTVTGTDRRIPLLREVYEQFPGVPVNVDIKVDDDELIRKVCTL